MKKILKRVGIVLGILCVLFVCAFGFYVGNYYKAVDKEAAQQLGVAKTEHKNYIAYGDEQAETAFIFYPGGKVEAESYEPVLASIAQQGTLCVLVKMPFRLAVFKQNAADAVVEAYPQVKNWYIGGHSLGGAMASSYVSKHTDTFKGLILYAAYAAYELPDEFPVIAMYGTEDKVLNMEKYGAAKSNAKSLTEVVIQGGNHAQFGNYGAQNKDGVATITPELQWKRAAYETIGFINR